MEDEDEKEKRSQRYLKEQKKLERKRRERQYDKDEYEKSQLTEKQEVFLIFYYNRNF